MKAFTKLIPLFLIIIATSCSDDDAPIVNAEPPSATTLIFPIDNTVCNEGTIVSDFETDVLFEWEEVLNASSYILKVTNLIDGTSRNISTRENEFLIRIYRGTPYSWSVKSLASGTTETADSAVWRFYNAGLAQESHPPFPAQAVSPQNGATINGGTVSLQWETSDIDNDIASYQLFLDTANPPVTEVSNTGSNSAEVTVTSGLTYYWKVVTTDQLGNASDSQIFRFGVN